MLDSENQKQACTDPFQCRCSWKFHKFYRKISVLESLFLMTLLALTLLKGTPTQAYSCEICEIFKNTFFLQNTDRGYFWKIYLDSPKKGGYILLVIHTGMQLFCRGYFFCWFMSPAVCEELMFDCLYYWINAFALLCYNLLLEMLL